MRESILIASASLDQHTFGPVKAILEKHEYEVITYLTDEVLQDKKQLSFEINKNGTMHVAYDGKSIHPDNIAAAWYRKLGSYEQRFSEKDLAKQLYINGEIGYVHDSFWNVYPDNIWLNSPDNIKKADRKFAQLLLARELGFSIPHTILTNSWDVVSAGLFNSNTDQAIVKTVRGVISEGNNPKAMYTTPINLPDIDRLKSYASPFPGLLSAFLEKGS